MKTLLTRASEAVRHGILKWWRPAYYGVTVVAVAVNGVALPLITKTFPDLTGLSLLVASAAPAAILRTVEKMKGLASA